MLPEDILLTQLLDQAKEIGALAESAGFRRLHLVCRAVEAAAASVHSLESCGRLERALDELGSSARSKEQRLQDLDSAVALLTGNISKIKTLIRDDR